MQKLIRYLWVPAVGAIAALFMVLPQTGGNVTVHIVGAQGHYRFEPSNIELRPGQRLEFINDTRETHTATCKGCGWDTGDIQPGQAIFKEFPTAGVFAFVCRYHPAGSEQGALTVRG